MKQIIFFAVLTFLMAVLLGKIIVPVFKKLHLGQPIRTEAPKSHIKKSGIPTLGGLIFIFPTLLTMIIFQRSFTREIGLVLLSFILFSIVGFLDDALKIYRRKNEGLTSRQKMLLLILVAIFLAFYIINHLSLGTSIIVPIFNKGFDLNIFYIPAIIFFYLCMTNAVNLTDGLDGLAASVSTIVLIFFTIISIYFRSYSISVFSAVLAASLLGFLRYNSYPASIIMGDTGSLALGGAIASIAIVLKLELIIILVGGIYVFETLTTLIQIVCFKVSGKHIFTMAPIHHAYELKGMHESKIVYRFSIVTIVLCLLAFLALS